MIPELRQYYNRHFTEARYQAFLNGIAAEAGQAPAFRVAETPVFVPAGLTAQLLTACGDVVDSLLQPNFRALTRDAIPPSMKVPHENDHPHFLIVDFAICRDEDGGLGPRLIELQGFPSLYAFQELMARQYREHFNIPGTVSNFLSGLDADAYFGLLQQIIVGPCDPAETVLLEVKPHEQKTRADFYYTERRLGIAPVCVTELQQEGRQLYYLRNGVKTRIRRIYNRVVPDDLQKQQGALGRHVHLFQDLDVEWITHPNWFYRISKYALPFIKSRYAPESWFLHQLPVIPANLEQYVLKPLFSFAGQGVVIDVTPGDIDRISDPENWILQRKVQYAPAIDTPDGPAFCEIRMMYLWPDNTPLPLLAHNLARISRGKMIGVSQNSAQRWVGGSCAFFEQA